MLINNKETAPNTAPETTPEVEAEVKAPETAAAPAPEAGALTKAAPTAVAVAGSFWCQDEAVLEVVSTAEYGDFPQIVASQGCFSESGNDGQELGEWIAFRPILAKEKKVCAPGVNTEEAKEYFAACYEGETLSDGRTIEEAVEDAKASGYEKASVKDYTDLFVKVVSHPDNDNFLADEIACLQLSPMSRIAWRKFSKRLQGKAAYGELSGDIVIKAVAKKAQTKDGSKYTHYTFQLAD